MRRRSIPVLYGWLFLAALQPLIVRAQPPITALAFSPDGEQLLVGSQAGLEVRTWPNLKPARSLPTQLANIHDVAFSTRGQLAVAGGEPGAGGSVELYSWPQGAPRRIVRLHSDVVYAVSWRSDGLRFATAGGDGESALATAGGETLLRLRGHSKPLLAVAHLPGDALLVSAGRDRSLRVWELDSGQARRTLVNHTSDVRDLAVRPGIAATPMIASAGADGTVRLWQPTIGRMVRFTRLPSSPLALAWSPDGATLYASCVDGRVRVIDPETSKLLGEHPAAAGWAYSLVAAPDGKHLAVGGANGQLAVVPLP